MPLPQPSSDDNWSQAKPVLSMNKIPVSIAQLDRRGHPSLGTSAYEVATARSRPIIHRQY